MVGDVPRPEDVHAPYPEAWHLSKRLARRAEWTGLRAMGRGRAAWRRVSLDGPTSAGRIQGRKALSGEEVPDEPRLAFIVTHGEAEPLWSIANFADGVMRAGYSPVIVYNGAPEERAVAMLRDIAPVVTRINRGHDFGAYRAVMLAMSARVQVGGVTRVVLANDSVYYPDSFGQLADEVDALAADVAGITWSAVPRPHIQSYFMRVGLEALRSPSLQRFWADYRPTSIRSTVIRRGEVGFSVQMIRSGLTVSAVTGPAAMAHLLRESGPEVSPLLGDAARVPRKFWRALGLSADAGGLPVGAPDALPPMNPSHAWGIVLNTLVGAPVKKDIWKSAALSEVVPFLTGYSEAQISDIGSDLERRLARFQASTIPELADYVAGNV